MGVEQQYAVFEYGRKIQFSSLARRACISGNREVNLGEMLSG